MLSFNEPAKGFKTKGIILYKEVIIIFGNALIHQIHVKDKLGSLIFILSSLMHL